MRQAQLEISSLEFTEWMGYYRLEPFGEAVADMRHGVATAVLANVNRDMSQRPEPYQPQDFIYWAPQETVDDDAPELIDDPVAHSNLIKAALFGKRPD